MADDIPPAGPGPDTPPEVPDDVTERGPIAQRIEPVVIEETAEPANEAEVVVAEPAKAEQEVEARSEISRKARNVGLFFASPFIALGYVIALPIVGFYQFIKLAREAHAKKQAEK